MGRVKIGFPHLQLILRYNRRPGAILAKGKKNSRKFLRVDKVVLDREWEFQAKQNDQMTPSCWKTP